MSSKISCFLKENKQTFIMFFLLLLYSIVIVNDGRLLSVDDITYAYHAVDYSLGFCSKLLPGAIYGFLVGIYSETAVTVYSTVLYLLFLLMISCLSVRFFKKFPDYPKAVAVLLLLLLACPFTLSMFVVELGLLDFYWMPPFLLSLVLLRKKALRFFVPLLVVPCIMVHYSSFVCYVAALILISFYYGLLSEKTHEKIKYILISALSFLFGAGSAAYFVVNDEKNLSMSVQKFHDAVALPRNISYTDYYDFYLFKFNGQNYKMLESFRYDQTVASPGLKGTIEKIFYQIKMTVGLTLKLSEDGTVRWVTCALGLIIFALVCYVLFGYIRKTPKKMIRLLTLGFMLHFLAIFAVGFCFSTDIARWGGHAVIVLFVYLFVILYHDFHSGMELFHKLFSKLNYWFVAAFCLIYCTSVIEPYAL